MAESSTQRKIIVQKLQVNQLLSKSGSHPADTRLLVEILIDGNVANKTQDTTTSKKSGDLSWNWPTELRIPGDVNEFTLRVLQHRSWGKNKSLGIVAINTGELIRRVQSSYTFSSDIEVTHRLIATNPGPLMEITLGYSVEGVSTKPEAVDMTRRVVSDSPATDRFSYADVTPASHARTTNQSVSSLTSSATWRSESPTIDVRPSTPPNQYSSLSSLRESETNDKKYAPPPAVTRVDIESQSDAENNVRNSAQQTYARPAVHQADSFPPMHQERRPPLEQRAETTPVQTRAVNVAPIQSSTSTNINYSENDNNQSSANQRVAHQNQGQAQSQQQQHMKSVPISHKRAETQDQAQMRKYAEDASRQDHIQQQDSRPKVYQPEPSLLLQSRQERNPSSQAVYRSDATPGPAMTHANTAATKPMDNIGLNYPVTQQASQYVQPKEQQWQRQEQAKQYILSEPVTSPSGENENRRFVSGNRESNYNPDAPVSVPSASLSTAVAGVSLAIPPTQQPSGVLTPVPQYTNVREVAGTVHTNSNDSYTREDARSAERTEPTNSRINASPNSSFDSHYNTEQGQREPYKQPGRDNSERRTEAGQYSRSDDHVAQNRSQNQNQMAETSPLASKDTRVRSEIESTFIATRNPRLVQEFKATSDSGINESNRQEIVKPAQVQSSATEAPNARIVEKEPRFRTSQYQSHSIPGSLPTIAGNVDSREKAKNDSLFDVGKLQIHNDMRAGEKSKIASMEDSRRYDDRRGETQAQSSYKSDATKSQNPENKVLSSVPVPTTYSHIPHQGFAEFNTNITPPRSVTPIDGGSSGSTNNISATPAFIGNIPKKINQPQNVSNQTPPDLRQVSNVNQDQVGVPSRSRTVLENQEPMEQTTDKSVLLKINSTSSSNLQTKPEKIQYNAMKDDRNLSAVAISEPGQPRGTSNYYVYADVLGHKPNNTVNDNNSDHTDSKVTSSNERVDTSRSADELPPITTLSNVRKETNRAYAVESSQSDSSSVKANQIKMDTSNKPGRSQAVSAPAIRRTDNVNSQQSNTADLSNISQTSEKAVDISSNSTRDWKYIDLQRRQTAPAILRPTKQSMWPFNTLPNTLSSSDTGGEIDRGRNRSRSLSRHVGMLQKGQGQWRRCQSWPNSRQHLIEYIRHENLPMPGIAVTGNHFGNDFKDNSSRGRATETTTSNPDQTSGTSSALGSLSTSVVASVLAVPEVASPTITFINTATITAVDELSSTTPSELSSPTSTLVQSPPISSNNSTSSSATLGFSASPSNLPVPLLDTGILGPAESLSRPITPIPDGKKQGVFNKLITASKNSDLKDKANELSNMVAPIVAPLIARMQSSETPQLLAGALQFLNRFVQVADALKKAHPILDVSITALTVAYKLIRNQTIQDQAIRHLSLVMNDMLACAQGVITDVTFGHLQRIIDRMFNEVRDCAEFIQKYFHHGFWGRTARLAVSSYSTDMIERFQHSFTDLKGSFNMAMNVQSLTSIEAVRQDIKELRADVDRGFDEVKARDLLKSLDRVRQVENDDECFCLPETRTELLRIIHSWIDSKEGGNIFWLPTISGWGKSTISATIRKEYIDANSSDNSARQRGAWFFCDRDSGKAEFADLSRIIPTLAYHLAHAFPGMKASLVEQLDINQDVISWNLENQVRRLLSEPLQNLTIPLSGPIVCIIDDVDACLNNARTSQASLRAFFRCISGSAIPLPPWFKILVTSRPLEFVQEQRNAIIFHDLDLNHPDNRADVSIYINHRLTFIQGKRNLPNSWQKDKSAKELEDRAGGLFRWAQLALDFIEESSDDGVDRLINFILVGKKHGSSPIEEVRSLYKKIRLYKNDLWETDDKSRGPQGTQKFGTY